MVNRYLILSIFESFYQGSDKGFGQHEKKFQKKCPQKSVSDIDNYKKEKAEVS
ncbi:Uncharacterized protein dnm_041660 [Desulfonema magnum]|uniref:Uncharacterized protein n=1 Tax=Desulfonema magnum TaxID=45655 RepID=A0A975BMA3_9BACT|nr:Uncharacterized protein dnm_041660 [Desulfonema magnum]